MNTASHTETATTRGSLRHSLALPADGSLHDPNMSRYSGQAWCRRSVDLAPPPGKGDFLRRTVRLVIALCALAAFSAPAAMAAERMSVRFRDDPSFRSVPDRASRIRRPRAKVRRSCIHSVQVDVDGADALPSSPANPFDPALQVRRHRRGAPAQRRSADMKVSAHDLRRPPLGEQRPEPGTSCRGGSAELRRVRAEQSQAGCSGRFNS